MERKHNWKLAYERSQADLKKLQEKADAKIEELKEIFHNQDCPLALKANEVLDNWI
jgi:hypothetical protein